MTGRISRLRALDIRFPRRVEGESELRWLGPEKGVVHLAAGPVINAVSGHRADTDAGELS